MSGLKRLSATPFLVSVAPRVCNCRTAAKELSSHKQARTAIANIQGYWNVYVGFFGDQTMWLDFMVTDTRDGRVIWKNGRQLTEEDYDTKEDGDPGRGSGRRRARPGEWIAAGRDPFL